MLKKIYAVELSGSSFLRKYVEVWNFVSCITNDTDALALGQQISTVAFLQFKKDAANTSLGVEKQKKEVVAGRFISAILVLCLEVLLHCFRQ